MSWASGTMRYGNEYVGRIFGDSKSTHCVTVNVRLRYASHILASGSTSFRNFPLYYIYSLRVHTDSRQSSFFMCSSFVVEYCLLVTTVRVTFIGDDLFLYICDSVLMIL